MRKTPGEGVFAPAERFPLCGFCRFVFDKNPCFFSKTLLSFSYSFFISLAIGVYRDFHEEECGMVQKL